MKKKYEPLFESFTFRSGVEVKNRVVLAPMTNFASQQDDGTVTEEELNYYAARTTGVGLAITACAYVTRNGKGFMGEFGADSDEMIPSLTALARTIKKSGAKAILQIFHGGRMVPPSLIGGEQPVSASAVKALRPDAEMPRELTSEEVREIIHAFGDATHRAIVAGFDGVEIHGANTYLIQQFYSPHSNQRTDKWGERIAFPLAVVHKVKSVVNKYAPTNFMVGYRFSPEEVENPGITMEDTYQLVDALAEQQLDYLHVSVQDFWAGSVREKEDTRSRVVLIQERVGNKVPVIGVGSLHTPEDVVGAMETGVPFIALGRELIMEPQWVEKVQNDQEDSIRTTLRKDDQQALVVPNVLWNIIMNTPGWFPVEQEAPTRK